MIASEQVREVEISENNQVIQMRKQKHTYHIKAKRYDFNQIDEGLSDSSKNIDNKLLESHLQTISRVFDESSEKNKAIQRSKDYQNSLDWRTVQNVKVTTQPTGEQNTSSFVRVYILSAILILLIIVIIMEQTSSNSVELGQTTSEYPQLEQINSSIEL